MFPLAPRQSALLQQVAATVCNLHPPKEAVDALTVLLYAGPIAPTIGVAMLTIRVPSSVLSTLSKPSAC